MEKMKKLFTSESVTEGHPDKVCDRVSDSILDAILAQDKNAHVACETTATTGRVNIMGEVSTTAKVDFEAIARKAVCEIGYDSEEATFDVRVGEVMVLLSDGVLGESEEGGWLKDILCAGGTGGTLARRIVETAARRDTSPDDKTAVVLRVLSAKEN